GSWGRGSWGRGSWASWGCGVLGCVLLVSLTALTPAANASQPPPPSQDPFYSYSGVKPLSAVHPGTVLKQRSVQLALGAGNSTPIRAEQLLYRTTGQLGEPTVTVTTVLVPAPAPVVPRIVDYLSFYDGLGSRCDPSYTLAGGNPGDSTYAQEADEEELLIGWYLSQGDIVTVPDFEGTHLAWMTGRESGYGAMDAIRATETYLRIGPATGVGLSGYSGGSVAADWASELAPAYAPELNIVGVAEGGIPANYFDHFAYIDGTAQYSAAIPGELLGLSRAYGIDLGRYLSPYGRQVVEQESNTCIASDFGKYKLTIRDIMKPPYRDLAHVAPFSTMLGDQTMGRAKTHPREPLFMGMGNLDGKGDGAMSAVDARALARRYCSEGVSVEYQEYSGASHEEAAALFEPQTGPFLQDRFAGAPFVDNCSTLGP
ncbi:MAG TPA: lipase family protein, partial [Acidimicrobiales bacterium]|nr:lipase family protein [Acidimicrobiales bacterium]